VVLGGEPGEHDPDLRVISVGEGPLADLGGYVSVVAGVEIGIPHRIGVRRIQENPSGC
jgi:hypothetical protein